MTPVPDLPCAVVRATAAGHQGLWVLADTGPYPWEAFGVMDYHEPLRVKAAEMTHVEVLFPGVPS